MLRLKFSAILFATIFLAVFTDCKKDQYVAIIGKCPTIVSTNPTNKDGNVPVNKVISATFNEKMNPATFTQESFLVSAGSKIQGTVSYNEADSSLRFVPTTSLAANTTFTAKVAAGVKDRMGNALQADYLWTFTTGTLVNTSAPTVISTDPLNGATSVTLNKVIIASFSEVMDPSSINAISFIVSQGGSPLSGSVTYSGTTARFTHADFLPNSVYTATIATTAKNAGGTKMNADYTWSFTTGTQTVSAAPVVISTDPVNNATNVPLNKNISATFSEPMDAASITGMSFMVKKGLTPVAGNVSYSGNTAFFTPSSSLADGATYNATITAAAKSSAGTPMSADYVWTFNTAVTPTIGVDLKSAAEFGIFAATGISNNAGFSVINDMNVGISPGVRSSVTGFPPAVVNNGAIYASDDAAPPGVAAMLTQAKQDLTNAYLYAQSASNPAPATVSGDQGGLTLAPGIYKSTSTLLIQSGNLTLDAQGDPNAFWIFQVASALTTVGGAGGSIVLTNGAQAKNIYWAVGSSATIGGNTAFFGNVLALTSITMNSNATAMGRMLVQNGAVTMTNNNTISKP